jgi:hypothetical protein
MFCEDSRAVEIDHYWPKAIYKQLCFRWWNMLLICGACNRAKGNKFPIKNGAPLLIDPTSEDPWDHIVYDSHTGLIVPRVDVNAQQDEKGRCLTDDSVLELNIAPITEGRMITSRNLKRSVQQFLERMGHEPHAVAMHAPDLLEAVKDNSCYGLAGWFFRHEGRNEAPFYQLLQSFPAVWRQAQASLER